MTCTSHENVPVVTLCSVDFVNYLCARYIITGKENISPNAFLKLVRGLRIKRLHPKNFLYLLYCENNPERLLDLITLSSAQILTDSFCEVLVQSKLFIEHISKILCHIEGNKSIQGRTITKSIARHSKTIAAQSDPENLLNLSRNNKINLQNELQILTMLYHKRRYIEIIQFDNDSPSRFVNSLELIQVYDLLIARCLYNLGEYDAVIQNYKSLFTQSMFNQVCSSQDLLICLSST